MLAHCRLRAYGQARRGNIRVRRFAAGIHVTETDQDSEVHRARSKKTGASVALKKIIMHHEKDGVRTTSNRRYGQFSDRTSFPSQPCARSSYSSCYHTRMFSHSRTWRSSTPPNKVDQPPCVARTFIDTVCSRQEEEAYHVHGHALHGPRSVRSARQSFCFLL